MGYTDWISSLTGDPASVALPGDLHPVERDALDSSFPHTAEHARRYVATGGADDRWLGPRPILILYTRGRRSGQIRRNPLVFLEFDGERYVVGSNGGTAAHPAWFANLRETPEVYVRVMDELYEAVADELNAEERGRVWPKLIEQYPFYASYQQRASREIPLVRLDRRQK